MRNQRPIPPASCDVLIVGAGPAGSATALMLARLLEIPPRQHDHEAGRTRQEGSAAPLASGAAAVNTKPQEAVSKRDAAPVQRRKPTRIVMVEISHFDDFRIGESLPPDSRVLLDRLGVLPAFLEDAHQPCWGSCSSWGHEAMGYNDFAVNVHGHGWHLERNRFDAMLARQAEQRGIDVHRGWRLREAVAMGDAGYRVMLRDNDHRERTLTARFVVDASGMAGAFTQAIGAHRQYDDRLVSISGVFDLKPDAAIDQRTLLEAAPYGWWYCARINAHQAIVSVTSDSATARQNGLASIGSWFGHLAQTPHLGARLHGSTLSSDGLRPWAVPCYRLTPGSGENWLAVGDSAISFDPITAQGIYKAMETGIAAARAIADRLHGNADDFSQYEQALATRYEDYAMLRKKLYALEQRWPELPFWKGRQQPRSNTIVATSNRPPLRPRRPGILPLRN